MPLLALWDTNPAAVTEMSIVQIVAAAGDGELRDDSLCSTELRQYLSQVSTQRLADFAEHCLTSSFPKSGVVLQDVVNELGRRLEYKVVNGKYQGIRGGVGFDGIWRSPDASAIVVEVKTTDTYRIALDTVARYRDKLQASGEVPTPASILIVVGRDDTGELEAQVRGSKHAWDMRLISVDSLISLVRVKEQTDSGATASKIRGVLVPVEYTRLDRLVDVMFATAADVEATATSEIAAAPSAPEVSQTGVATPMDTKQLTATREAIIAALQLRDSKKLIKRSRSLYWDAAHDYRVACTISKRYASGNAPYWYAYHPSWDTFLSEGAEGWFVMGCIGLPMAFAVPASLFRQHLSEMNTTTTEDGKKYWHVKIVEPEVGQFALLLRRPEGPLPLMPFAVPLTSPASGNLACATGVGSDPLNPGGT